MFGIIKILKNKKKPDDTYSRTYALPSASHRFTSKFEMELGGTSGLLSSGNCVCETYKEFTLRLIQADRAISTSKLNPLRNLHI